MSLADIRREYLGQPLDERHSDADPFRQFSLWFEQVKPLEADPTAMALATATRDGRPSVRTVLLKGLDPRGFVFFTNYESRKAREMTETGRASLLFFWRSVERQVRVNGTVEKVAAQESDAYFATRPLDSRLSVYASRQSEVLDGRATLEARFDTARQTYADGHVPRPAWWGGYRVIPDEVEFWQGRESRLHDRLQYRRNESGVWIRERLAP
jgi:pyridoxamine 5'-phosphate oxidase